MKRAKIGKVTLDRAALAFMSKVEAAILDSSNGNVASPCRVVFLCGAGFSKAWTVRSPLSAELFSMPSSFLKSKEPIGYLLDYLGKSSQEKFTVDDFKQITTFLDICAAYEFFRPFLFDINNVRMLRNLLATSVSDYYKTIHFLNHLKPNEQLLPIKAGSSHRKVLSNFLRELLHDRREYRTDGAGVHISFITTNYDFAIESWLQSALNDEVFSLLYRGFTPQSINGSINKNQLISTVNSIPLIKLNGGFEIFYQDSGLHIDYHANNMDPHIILPSDDPNYRSAYFEIIFHKALSILRDADVLIVVGYSFPNEDLLIRHTLRAFCEFGSYSPSKLIVCVNKKSRIEISESVRELFRYGDSAVNPHIEFYKGDFNRFCNQCNYLYGHLRRGAPLLEFRQRMGVR